MKKNIIRFLTIFISILFMHGFSQASYLSISKDKMTLNSDRVPLQVLLKQLIRRGIKVKIDPEINPKISADFKDKEIQAALSDILKGYDHALIWTRDNDKPPRLSEIVIFRPGKITKALPMKQPKNLQIEKNPNTNALQVKNKILTAFKNSVPHPHLKQLLSKLGATIQMVNKDLGVYQITLPDSADLQEVIDLLRKDSHVGAIEPDYAYRASENVRYNGLGENSIHDPAPDTIETSFSVAVLDTGLMEQYTGNSFNHAAFDALSPETSISDSVGHGTQMALIASGQIHPMGTSSGQFSNPVISVRAFDDNGFTSNSILMKSIDYALENGAKVLSLSWSSETKSSFLESAMNYARSRGLIIVAAAGNSPTGKPVYPAGYDSVISVSALAPDGNAWKQSNYGDFVDIAAPGFASLPVGNKGDPGTYAGTSISTAYIAGKLAAYLRKNPGVKTIDTRELFH